MPHDSFPSRGLRRTVAPASEPITLAETKLFLRIDHADEDGLIATLITVAREAAEQYLNQSLLTQTWEITYEDTAPNPLSLAMRPVQSITSVITDGNTISNTLYRLNARKDALDCDVILSGNIITITYITGYGSSAASVPSPIKHAILTHIASLYDDRSHEAMTAASRALLHPYREVRL